MLPRMAVTSKSYGLFPVVFDDSTKKPPPRQGKGSQVEPPGEVCRFLCVVDADALARFERRGLQVRAGGGQPQFLQPFTEEKLRRAIGQAVEPPVDVQPGAHLAGAVEEVLLLIGGQANVK